MRTKIWILGTALMMVIVLAAAVTWIDRSELIVRAETENGDEVLLSHVHSGEGGACYHQHQDGCYTVPVSCNGNITQKRGSICGSLKKWWGTPDDGIERCYASCNACGQFWDHKGDDYGDYHYNYDWTCDSCGTQYTGGGTCSSIARYDIGCSKDEHVFECEQETCGSYYITCNDTAVGLESTTLTANVSSYGAGASATSYQWSTGDTEQTITVTRNGTYTCEITYTDQKSGEVSTAGASYAVTNLDNIPPEVSLSYSPSAPTNTGTTIHMDATDNVGVTGYSFDGVNFTEEQELYVTENGSYTAYATDASGNIGSAVITVDNIDHEAPQNISVMRSTEAQYVNGDIEIHVSAQDKVSEGYAREISVEYSLDGETWNSSGDFSFAGDGTQEILVRDAAGNISTAQITVYQDTDPPAVSGTQNPQTWTKDAVCLTLTASDDQSGIPEWAYKWMDGDWNPASYINVTENGAYEVEIRDAAGNTAMYTFHVTQIDRTAPQVQTYLKTADWHEGTNMIYVRASDSESGLAEEAYSYDGGVTWTGAAEHEISDSGDYRILVRDVAGNVAESRIHAAKTIQEPAAEPAEDDLEDDFIPEEYHTHWNDKDVAEEVPPSGTTAQMILQSAVQTMLQTAEQEAEEPSQIEPMPKIILSISIPRSATPAESGNVPDAAAGTVTDTRFLSGVSDPLLRGILAAVICGLCTFGGLFILWRRNSRKAALYAQEPDGKKYRLIDRFQIERSRKGHVIRITDRRLAEQMTENIGRYTLSCPPFWPMTRQSERDEQRAQHYVLKFSRRFGKRHRAEKLEVQFCTGNRMVTKIESEILI